LVKPEVRDLAKKPKFEHTADPTLNMPNAEAIVCHQLTDLRLGEGRGKLSLKSISK
jgi:hypothetical protein